MKSQYWTVLLILVGTSVSVGKPQTKDPPGTTIYMAPFRAWFAGADTNKDGVLDKEELAHAFRGPFAKPYDYVPPPKEKKVKDKDKPAPMSHADEEDNSDKAKAEKDETDKDRTDRDSKNRE